MQAADVAHKLVTGTQVEMVGIAQHERGVDLLEMVGREHFDRCLRADRREDRREELAVRRGEYTCAGAVIPGSDLEFEHDQDYNGIVLSSHPDEETQKRNHNCQPEQEADVIFGAGVMYFVHPHIRIEK